MLLKYFASLLLSPLHWIVMYIVTSAKLLLFFVFCVFEEYAVFLRFNFLQDRKGNLFILFTKFSALSTVLLF